MASTSTSNVTYDSISDITQCPVCLESMTDPRILPCIHSFCFKCLYRYCEEKQADTKVACPLCRTEFDLPSGGIGGLRKNFFVQKLVETQN